MSIKKMKILIILSFGFFSAGLSAKAVDMGDVKAYPNPLAASSQNLTIEKKTGTFSSNVTMIVYDFNLKKVFEQSSGGAKIFWNGHNSGGEKVAPGLYFIKLIEIQSDASVATKFIKLLIK